jgi:hypothetical protein
MTKRIILTADDFGYNPAVSKAIVDLIKRQRLSAASCMTNMSDWHEYLAELLEHQDRCSIGLHFNLTDGCLISTGKPAYELKNLIMKSYLRQLRQEDIELELQSQINEFKAKTGFLPNYIDGHQHIQQLPVIRNALIKVIHKNWPDKKPYMRIASNGLLKSWLKPKALILHLLGSDKLKKLCIKNQIPCNSSFSGVYNLRPNHNYAQVFAGFLNEIQEQGIIMCHPGLATSSTADPIHAARATEYEFFQSDEFLELLVRYKIRISMGEGNLERCKKEDL